MYVFNGNISRLNSKSEVDDGSSIAVNVIAGSVKSSTRIKAVPVNFETDTIVSFRKVFR